MNAWIFLGLSFLSSVLYGLGFPPTESRLAPWVALVPFLVSVRYAERRTMLGCAWVFAVAGAYWTAEGLPRTASNYYGQPVWLGIFFFLILATVTTATIMVFFATVVRRSARLSLPLRVTTIGAGWVAYELIRARLIGNPWGIFGYTQAGVDLVVQVADVTGVYGVSFLLAVLNATLAEAVVAGIDARSAHLPPWRVALLAGMRGCVVAVPVVVLVCGYGWWRLRSEMADGPAVRVAVVQGNIDVGSQWREDLYGKNLDHYLRLTVLAQQNRVALVVWPENSMTFFLAGESSYLAAIGRALREKQTQLVAGGPHLVEDAAAHYFNSAFLVSPDGEIRARYDKQQLLPFAESFPFSSVEFLRRRFGRVREFTPGGSATLLPTVAGKAGVMICNESLFPEIAAERVAGGAEYLLNLTNDGWLNDRKLSGVAYAMSRFRAVEQRRPLVRASTSGPSAFIDPWGRIQEESNYMNAEYIIGAVRPAAGQTVYGRVGDVFAGICVLLSLVVFRRRPSDR